MKSNSRHHIYKFYALLRSKLEARFSSSHMLVKLISWIKDAVVRVYVFYVSRLKYSFSARLFSIGQEKFVNEVEAYTNDIIYLSQNRAKNQNKLRLARGGSWDRLDQKIKDSELYLAFSDALVGNEDLENSQLGNLIMTGFMNGQSLLGCADIQSFLNQWRELVNIFHNKGSKDEVVMGKFLSNWEPIFIDIGRHGDLLLSQGEFSLNIAKIFDLKKIPVQILTRHTKWVIFRKRFQDLVTTVGSRAYQPPLHPDLTYIPAEQSCVERYELIKKNLSFKTGRLLELGANAGFFSIKFENDGFNCIAVENFPGFVYCLRGQRRALNKTFTIIADSFLEREDILRQQFEVVLALNVLSHLTVHKADFEKLTHFLENLNCKEMFFEPYSPNDPQMRNAYVNMHEDEFADFVRSKLRLSRAELIGTASDKRRIYKIY